ncbi:acetyl-CoA carboxylase biotin carboxyl carrier protein [Varunaivibrio sulfuroxidans]|uniref:Biotin carboxyl carrier protein of acetyl-CoA carboxylase n=1 Tax=Varunaivibrio sulfuroxidans TaxID=1773489 RepID=A0A4R3J8J9_9PROT|nr:acetyl-CoA carboxylase biotin carboxyl carrier protein [Varunaivibrio sulfuroxidans]TCS61246.1 acetyl-CoA carboxylase biotin carboxyl carrier protein [Varunaivibrio sulfuroxidans]WES31133.1 acetyl-CoA carboxylase biotin carboxyl carrier protein [Varunaivibrio sulfuroxidans]
MTHKLDVDDELIRKLAAVLDETGLTEIEYGQGDVHVRIARTAAVTHIDAPRVPHSPAPVHGAPPVDAPAPAPSPAEHPGVVTSPMVGVVYTSAEPGAPAFVNVGDVVKAGDTVMLVEAMKVFNQIHAPKDGTVTEILVETGAPIEFGEPLLIIE